MRGPVENETLYSRMTGSLFRSLSPLRLGFLGEGALAPEVEGLPSVRLGSERRLAGPFHGPSPTRLSKADTFHLSCPAPSVCLSDTVP